MPKLYLLLVFFCQFISAQTEPEFVTVKEKFGKIHQILDDDLKRLYHQTEKQEDKKQLLAQYELYKHQIDSAQNTENIYALVAYKTRKLVDKFVTKQQKNLAKNSNLQTQEANYPGGISELRNELSQKVYVTDLDRFGHQLETLISFDVEPNGSVWVHETQGPNTFFNRQAEIAVYGLQHRFQPAIVAGRYVSSRFKMPLKLIFD